MNNKGEGNTPFIKDWSCSGKLFLMIKSFQLELIFYLKLIND